MKQDKQTEEGAEDESGELGRRQVVEGLEAT